MKAGKKHSPFVVGDFEIKSVKEDEPDNYIIDGYASVYGNVDSYKDVVMPGAFAEDLRVNGNERTILWQHQSDQPIGLGVFEETSEGLKVSIKLPKGDDFVNKRVMPQVKVGAVKGMSIGYWTLEENFDSSARVNRLTKLKLRENSIVTFPANELAQITAAKQFLGIEDHETEKPKMFKFADKSVKWDKDNAIESIKSNSDSDSHIGYLTEDESYPYVKYIDGEFRIIPVSIFMAASKLADCEDSTIKEFINSVYVKLGHEEPFKLNKFFVDKVTLKYAGAEELENILSNENAILSTGAKKEIIEALCSPDKEGPVRKSDDVLNALRELNNL